MNVKKSNTKTKFTGHKARDLMNSGLLYRCYNDYHTRRIYTPVPSFEKPLSSATEIPKKKITTDKNSGRAYLLDNLTSRLRAIAKLRKADNIFLYGSAFLQKQDTPPNFTMMMQEDINGIMNTLYGMKFIKNKKHRNKIIIVLHIPGGDSYAANSIVEYLQNKFDYIEVIVPCVAMSAGAMLSLSSDCIIMGKQSQLGPIDPEVILNEKFVTANDMITTFNKAKKEIAADPNLSLLWQPTLRDIKPGFIDGCEQALKSSEETLKRSLIERDLIIMDSNDSGKEKVAKKLLKHLNGNYENDNDQNKKTRAHSRRIGIEDLKTICFPNNLNIELLEDNQKLQDEVMSAYHLMTILFEHSPITKIIHPSHTSGWAKEFHNTH